MNQLSERRLTNPILSGFYPDPSICRVGADFYLVNSSFELFPGLPIFHSRDLVHWRQIGHALDRPSQVYLKANSLTGGLMAPTIRYHNGVFYIINANFCDAGNYLIKAENPAGPWSDPYWLNDITGIDASLFFDEDGRCYITGTGTIPSTGERGIYICE
ncbi:MAG: family 43 glycosylhydrolase, partial [Clostridia bacterium]|nr:family 43 glycosylhydrolase [Clostridia bacterium]